MWKNKYGNDLSPQTNMLAVGLLTAIGIPATQEMIERVIKTAGEALEDELLCEWVVKYAPIIP